MKLLLSLVSPAIMRYLIITIIYSSTHVGLAQRYEKTIINNDDPKKDYYLQLDPQDINEILHVLVLLPGFGQAPETIFTESMLPYVAYSNNMMIVAFAGGDTIFLEGDDIKRMNLILSNVKKTNRLSSNVKWIIGGFSAGGSIALRYVEYCEAKNNNCPANFDAVFTVDSPVDLKDLWNYFDREISKGFSEAGVSESAYISGVMKKQAGTPTTNPQNYARLNPFDVSQKQGNERFLRDVAVRTYHDVDIAWQLNNRQRSVFDSNYLNASELILRLNLMGNDQAEFIQGETGYRSNGMRHPHSWSIVDEVECIQWIKNLN